MSTENGMSNGEEEYGEGDESKVCRDFMRNVCNRGKSCKFIHPADIKIRTDPIFCHDFQQSKCFRSTCKFIHCTREEEDHYKATGELPEAYIGTEFATVRAKPLIPRGMPAGRGRLAARSAWATDTWVDSEDIPLCKDFLKGQCDRPPGGCKFRHVDSQFRGSAVVPRRRPAAVYESYEGVPEAKRSLGYSAAGMSRISEYDEYYSTYTSPPPPPPQQIAYTTTASTAQGTYGINEINFGRNGYGQSVVDSVQPYTTTTTNSAGMKALEDENFMLKRRIEELKKQVNDLTATNDYLLSQNAHYRLGIPKDSSASSVVQTLVSSMSQAQPMGMTMTPSLSVCSTPMSTMSTIPSASMTMTPVSMSQPMPVVSMAQHPGSLNQSVYPMVTTQGVLQPPN